MVINLGIRRCAPTPGHHTHYWQCRSGRRVFAKLSNMARSITTKISFQRCITPKQSLPNFNNLQIIPIEYRVQSSTSNNKVHLSLVNTRSLPLKGEELKHYITEKAIDICAIIESWIHKDAATPEGYAIISKPCQDGHKGSGIALMYNKVSVTLMEAISFEFREAECSLFKVRIDQKQLDLCLLYHYPEGSVLTFFEDLSNAIERTVISSNELLILGDFNIKADLCDTVEALTISDFLDLFNLKNHVNFPTHNRGHTLDLVLSDNTSTTIVKVTQGDFISDHCLINY